MEALILVAPANVLVMPQPEADSDLFASVRAALSPEEVAEFDAFMETYMDFGNLFGKSDNDLVEMNLAFGEYYISVVEGAGEVEVSEVEQGRPGGWMVWAQYLSMGQRHDHTSALAAVDAPVLVLHGRDDLQSEAASRMYADAFSDATFVVIENAGHFSFDEQPEAFARAVQEFLGGVEG